MDDDLVALDADTTTTRFQCVGNVNMAEMMMRASNSAFFYFSTFWREQ